MTQEERVARINALAHKAKTEGLTEEETQEREQLRQAYLQDFRTSLRAQLDNTWVVTPDGKRHRLQKKDKQNTNR